jgi:SnoaL-like protein
MTEHDVRALLGDYIGLYARDTLPRWRELFLPDFIATAPNDDGTVTTWGLDAFYERQRASFATGLPIVEMLENTHIGCTGKLACVRSDFVWSNGAVARRGRLMLLLVAAGDRFKVQALTFSYGA